MNRGTSCSRYGALTWEERPWYYLHAILNGPRAIAGLVVKSKTSSYLFKGRSSRCPAILSRAQQLELSVWPQAGHSFSICCAVTAGGARGPRCQWFNLQHMQTVTLNSVVATTLLNDSLSHPTPPPWAPSFNQHHNAFCMRPSESNTVESTQSPAPNLCRPCKL